MLFTSGDVKESRKRKMKEISETPMPALTSYWPFNTMQYPPTALRFNINRQYNSNARSAFDSTFFSAPKNFQSFTELLTAEDSSDNPETTLKEQIEQAIASHSFQLNQTLANLQQMHCTSFLKAAEEKTARKLKDKEMELCLMARKKLELEEKIAHTKMELKQWKANANQMQRRWASLQSACQMFMTRRGRSEFGAGCSVAVRQEEDQQSSHVDPDQTEFTNVLCRVCGKQATTMVLWQCHHLCVCKSCDVNTKICPVCKSIKTWSTEVNLE